MAAHLLIQDGSPQWWMSQDIWVVPGSDPNGPPGSPIAGKPAYLWALVANTGDTAANGARVDFYWANPAMQIVVGVATLIGSAFVDLAPGAQQQALCLVPWVPSIVNGGHECVLAVAHSQAEASPLPDPLPAGFDFNPPQYDEIAQRNLSVLAASARAVPRALTITAPNRADKTVRITAETGGRLSETLLAQLGLEGFRPAPKEVVQVGLGREAVCGQRDMPVGTPEIELHVPKGTSAGVFASIHATGLAEDEYHLVHLVERSEDRVLGGLSFVIIHSRKGAAA
ncbi:hypothetical protein SAMN05444161_0410 [Rhizobiales bacterium GAS191]|nr:hypothetical protein SAMN05519103_07899 [Rhizobiales bacterium GAS113]SEC05447.1 hypothetical protein SAMN05444161_0410 [Rhizobiales bacterium GAS191]